jgi:hypothetical protein
VTVIDGRPELVDEVRLAPEDLQKYLSDEFGSLLSSRDFLDALRAICCRTPPVNSVPVLGLDE